MNIYCSNCGQLIPSTSNFCRFCGVPQHGEEASVYKASQPIVDPGDEVVSVKSADIEYIPRSHLSPAVILVFIANYVKTSIMLFFLLAIGIYFQPLIFSLALLLWLVILAAIAVFSYTNFTYKVDEDGLMIEFGIVHHKTISVPFGQVQNVNIEKSVIDRILNLSRISIETAGSANTQLLQVIGGYTAKSEAYIPGLTYKDAARLQDILIDGKLDGDE